MDFAARERSVQRVTASVPYVTLAGTVVVSLTVLRQLTLGPPWVLISVCGAAFLWVLVLGPRTKDMVTMNVVNRTYYLGLLAFAAVIVVLNPIGGLFAYTGYVHGLRLPSQRWKVAGAAYTGVWAALSQIGGVHTLFHERYGWAFYLAMLAFNLLFAGAMSHLSSVMAAQSEQRRVTAEKLAATLEENATLHAQLLVQAREAGIQEERQRMAGEIHDTLAQGLTGIITQLQATARSEDRHIAAALRLARENLAEARRSVQAIGPSELDDRSLPEALRAVAERWSAHTGVPSQVSSTGTELSLHPEIEATLLRTAQEALSNVAKHARAAKVGVTLSYMDDVVTLDVRDDGVGFTPGGKSDGYGLTAMRARVKRLAGTVDIESEPGGGTAVSAAVPAIGVPA
ncbi:sensor histidine kinase [Pseudonocardiaceae bacterium YIM PH 21723]|nr:sensor histidine kinase [Pseudonocardiaceae bacterium YIM PH 21723]